MTRKRGKGPILVWQRVECPHCHTQQEKMIRPTDKTYKTCSACRRGFEIDGPVSRPVGAPHRHDMWED